MARVRVGVPPISKNPRGRTGSTHSSPHNKVPSKVLAVLLRGRRVEGLGVVLRHRRVFGQGFEEGDVGVEEPLPGRVGVGELGCHHGRQLVDLVVVEVGAGCGRGVEGLGGGIVAVVVEFVWDGGVRTLEVNFVWSCLWIFFLDLGSVRVVMLMWSSR